MGRYLQQTLDDILLLLYKQIDAHLERYYSVYLAYASCLRILLLPPQRLAI